MNVKDKKCFIFDLDGTVYMGDVPIQGTIDFIRKKLKSTSIYFMTNNTSKTPEEYVIRLKKFGLEISLDQIISPFIPLFNYLIENNIRKIYPLANSVIKEYLIKRMPDLIYTSDYKECEAIVMTFDTELTYEKIKTASLILQKKPNVKYVATHPDNVCPTNEGNIPDVGAFMKLLEMTTGRVPEKIFGKPNVELLQSILSVYKKDDCVVVGDRLYTDKILAENAGIDFILVLSGEATREQVEKLEKQPSMIVNHLGNFIQ